MSWISIQKSIGSNMSGEIQKRQQGREHITLPALLLDFVGCAVNMWERKKKTG